MPLSCTSLAGHKVWIKRDDLLHAHVSGNKLRKLKYPLLELAGRRASLISMGGPWSNHLHALAHAGALLQLPSVGLVRGNAAIGSAALDDCRRLGMQLHYVTHDDYRALRNTPDLWRDYQPALAYDAPPFWLPEGGSSPAALRGVAEIVEELEAELGFVPDIVAVACGTGATLAGLLAGLRGRSHVIGIAVFKNAGYLHQEIATLLQQAGHPAYQNYTLYTDYHHGGYAKAPIALREFCRAFTEESGVPVEPVYTGKLFHALQLMAQNGALSSAARIVALHTGGLQGARGFS